MQMTRLMLFVALLVCTMTTAALADLRDGLVAYYPFNGNADDATGHGYDGTVRGATLTQDRLGNKKSAYSYDGKNASIRIGPQPDFPSWDAYAVSLWFLNDGGGYTGQGYGQKILSKGDFATDFHLSVHSEGFLVFWSDQGGFEAIADRPHKYRDHVWHHVVLLKKTAHKGELWVDGVLQGSSNTLERVVNDVDLLIGFTDHTDEFQQRYWSGKIDDIRIYNRVLSKAEILELSMEGASLLCDGLRATIVGTNGNDILVGTAGADVIVGLSGDDVIYGLGGHDILCGGPGNDILWGGSGRDRLFGEDGEDVLRGGSGADYLEGGAGRDSLRGDDGNDWLIGSEDDDMLDGEEGNDRLEGGPGRDRLFGGPGNDQLVGGAANDQLFGGPDDDALSGGNGSDFCDGSLESPADTADASCERVLNMP